METNSNSQPFWQDEPASFQPQLSQPLGKTLNISLMIYRVFIMIVLVSAVFAILYSMHLTVAALAWLVLIGLAWLWGFFSRKRKRDLIQQIALIQDLAKKRIGAGEIGSAIHVAGHPLLQREQPVVLAWVESSGFCIYGYETDRLIDAIPLNSLIRTQTIVYDDERVPHMDVVDSAAQALQIAFVHGDQEFTALFRSMKKLRPVDWYHILQKARLG